MLQNLGENESEEEETFQVQRLLLQVAILKKELFPFGLLTKWGLDTVCYIPLHHGQFF